MVLTDILIFFVFVMILAMNVKLDKVSKEVKHIRQILLAQEQEETPPPAKEDDAPPMNRL